MVKLFQRRFRIKKEDINMIRPTSKASLKSQCLLLSNGDVDRAERLYDFYIKDMEDLPMFDMVAPSAFDNIKNTGGQIFGVIKDNKDDIIQVVQFIQSIIKHEPPSTNIIPKYQPLPPINK